MFLLIYINNIYIYIYVYIYISAVKSWLIVINYIQNKFVLT